MREKNELTSQLCQKYPDFKIPPWVFPGLNGLYAECVTWNLSIEELVRKLPAQLDNPYFYLRAVVKRLVEEERVRRVSRVLKQRAKQKQTYYGLEEY